MRINFNSMHAKRSAGAERVPCARCAAVEHQRRQCGRMCFLEGKRGGGRWKPRALGFLSWLRANLLTHLALVPCFAFCAPWKPPLPPAPERLFIFGEEPYE